MLNYCKVCTLKDIRRFSGWIEVYKEHDRCLSDESICYLWEDFIVSTSLQRDKHIIFDTITDAWIAYCKNTIEMHMPAIAPELLLPRLSSLESAQRGQTLNTGFLPTMPIHLHCLSRPDTEPHIFNVNTLLEIPSPLQYETLLKTTFMLLARHEALRLRFVQNAFRWQTYIADLEEDLPFWWIDLSAIDADRYVSLIESDVASLQNTLDLSHGPLMRIVYFQASEQCTDRLLFLFHHFTLDAFSLQIFLRDFFLIYQRLTYNLPLPPRPKSTSIKTFAEQLMAYAQSDALLNEAEYWVTKLSKQVHSLTVDYPDGIAQPDRKNFVMAQLDEEETGSLFALGKQHIILPDILLTALFQAYSAWTGQHTMLVEILDIGRIPVLKDVNLLHTIGWLNHLVPFVVDVDQTLDLKETLLCIKEDIHSIPNRGIGYGVLRYLGRKDIAHRFAEFPSPQILFNYQGKFTEEYSDASSIRPAQEKIEGDWSRGRIDPTHLRFITRVVNKNLYITWEYQENMYKRTTIERLHHYCMEALHAIQTLNFCSETR